MSKIAKESIFQLLPRNAHFYLTANLNTVKPCYFELDRLIRIPSYFEVMPNFL